MLSGAENSLCRIKDRNGKQDEKKSQTDSYNFEEITTIVAFWAQNLFLCKTNVIHHGIAYQNLKKIKI